MQKEQIRLNNDVSYNIDRIVHIFNLLKITFDAEVNIEEFVTVIPDTDKIEILTRSGQVYGEFKDFNTVYRIEEQTVILSNDGSIYMDPVEPDPQPIPEYVPTLEEVRTSKISELSTICNEMITNGVSMDLDGDGESENYSYRTEDQTNIKDAFDLALQTGLCIPYHANNGGCILYPANQIIDLYISQKTNLTHHTTYFNQLKMYIMSLEDKEIINAINYGDELTGEYLDAYNIAMAQAKAVIDALLSKTEDNQETIDETTAEEGVN